LRAPQSIFSSVHRVARNGWLEKREEYRHMPTQRCSLLAEAPGLNKCSSPPLDLRLDQPLSRRQRPTGAFRLWVIAWRHHDSLALRKGSRVLATARCLLCGHTFWNHGFHATSIALPLARVALNSIFSSVLLVDSDERLEKKLLRSLPRCVACDGRCESRCLHSERVCVPLCLRCGMFAWHSILLSEEVDVRQNHNTNRRCQRYCREHHARLVLALSCRRALLLPFTSRAGAAPRSLQARGLQFSASFRLWTLLPTTLTRNHDIDNTIASGHGALLPLSFALASTPSHNLSSPARHHGPVLLPPPPSKHRRQLFAVHTAGGEDASPQQPSTPARNPPPSPTDTERLS
jgi:hypothetical protein